jgi:ComF family protein
LREAPGTLLQALFPSYCCLCQRACDAALPLCADCRRALPRNQYACHRCALPLPALPDQGTVLQQPEPERLCGACIREAPPFDQVIAPWIYDAHFAYLIGRWKYTRQQSLTALLAQLWIDAAPPVPTVDLLVPVPLHWRKLWQRGFNQATLLATALQQRDAQFADCPIAVKGVRRLRPGAPQSRSGAEQRQRNLRAAFTVDRPCDNLRVAIIDDVVTTGATASALAGALRAQGAARVDVWSLARTPAPGNPRQA